MSMRKRKKYSTDIKCVYFPDELNNSVKKIGKDSPLSVQSTVKSWEKCGDSFLDTPIVKKPKSSVRTVSAIKKLSKVLLSDSSSVQQNEEPVHIAWSDSDASQDETKEEHVGPKQMASKLKRNAVPFQSRTSAPQLLIQEKNEPPVIDNDSDIIQSEEEVDSDGGQLISDCDSELSKERQEEVAHKPTIPLELEISDYESDDGPHTQFPCSTMDSCEDGQRSLSHWVRCAQALLQTPEKVTTEKQHKTPEDSATKRRKFQSGGLAERLNRLQHRQRSAISFWRHKSVSENPCAVDRPEVLVLEVVEVQEECSMRLVRCEPYTPPTPPTKGHRDEQASSEDRAPLLVLFNKETTAQLNPHPQDVIHIYPPWQSLSVEGYDCNVILNTHFSQKVSSSKSSEASLSSRSAHKCMPYSLAQVFGLLEVCETTEDNNNKQDIECVVGEFSLPGHCQSLLDAIEALGQAGCVEQSVEVVVQRVYSIVVPDSCPGFILKHRIKTPAAPPTAGKAQTRLCVLVQDSYGMFSVVQLHLLESTDDLQKYCQMWQGKTCLLRAIKVLQRITRERHTRLFGLIHSLWPPLVPLKHHGSTPTMQREKVAGPPPSFCYLLCGQESSVVPFEDQSESPLYFAPKVQTLKQLMQNEQKSFHCSFTATVLHHKKQKSNIGQGDVWLAITDPSLQEEQQEATLKRTAAVCVNASCALTSSVLEALNSPAVSGVLFRDVIKQHDIFLCTEQSVITLCPVEPAAQSLGVLCKPVRLDVLDWGVTPSSLCTVSGVIVGVDENTAYSWPACSHCGSDHLEMLPHQSFHCVSCKVTLDKPETRIQLEVILSHSSMKDCTIKMKLQKKTILSLLNISALEGGEFSGYDVESVLGKELGPLNAYVRLITRKPSLWIGLEEISL